MCVFDIEIADDEVLSRKRGDGVRGSLQVDIAINTETASCVTSDKLSAGYNIYHKHHLPKTKQ